jgi:SRSO17 transposase
VARQYCGTLGKIANCQVAVSLHWSSTSASCPLSWRLYLPKEWLADKERAAEVKLPEEIRYRSKTELALDLIDQALAWEVPPLPVLADSAYGNSFEFREALRKRGLHYFVAVEPGTVVWRTNPNMPLPAPGSTGRPRQYPRLTDLPPAQSLEAVAKALPASAWRKVTWRQGTRGPQCSRFAQVQVWAAHGWKAQAHPERVAEWLLIEWPAEAKDPTDYWLGFLGTQTVRLARSVSLARGRWRVEQDYRELKDELGLDHYEGRHWLGWHHHVTLVTLAYAFLRTEQEHSKKNFWCHVAHDTETSAGDVDSPGGPLSMVPEHL